MENFIRQEIAVKAQVKGVMKTEPETCKKEMKLTQNTTGNSANSIRRRENQKEWNKNKLLENTYRWKRMAPSRRKTKRNCKDW